MIFRRSHRSEIPTVTIDPFILELGARHLRKLLAIEHAYISGDDDEIVNILAIVVQNDVAIIEKLLDAYAIKLRRIAVAEAAANTPRGSNRTLHRLGDSRLSRPVVSGSTPSSTVESSTLAEVFEMPRWSVRCD